MARGLAVAAFKNWARDDPTSVAGVAQGAPAAAGGAHFHPNRHGAGLAFALVLPPGFGIGPGGLKRVVVVIENGVGQSVAIDEPIKALLL